MGRAVSPLSHVPWRSVKVQFQGLCHISDLYGLYCGCHCSHFFVKFDLSHSRFFSIGFLMTTKKFWYSGFMKQKNMTLSDDKQYKLPLPPSHPITEGNRKRWTKLRDKRGLDKWDIKVSFYHHAFQWLKVHFWWTEINQGNNGDHFAFSRDKRMNSKLCGHQAGQCWRHALK